MSNKSNYLNGVIYCLVATLSWGAMFPVMTHALNKIDPFSFTLLRYTIAGIVFLAFLYLKEGISSFKLDGNIWLLWLFGSAGFAGFGFFVFLGQKIAGPEGALSASMMMATMPLLGLLVSWQLRGNKPPMPTFLFIGLSFLGVLLVITKGKLGLFLSAPTNYFANFLMLAGALCWVLYTIGATYFSGWSPIKYTAFSTLLGLPTIYIITLTLFFTHTIPVPNIKTIYAITPELLYMALGAGFIGVLSWNIGNKIITPINGVLFMDVVPITSFIISSLEGITPTSGQLIGVSFTVLALILNNLYQRYRILTLKNQTNTIIMAKSN